MAVFDDGNPIRVVSSCKVKRYGSTVASFERTTHMPEKYGNLVNLSYLRDSSAKLDCPLVGEGERNRVQDGQHDTVWDRGRWGSVLAGRSLHLKSG